MKKIIILSISIIIGLLVYQKNDEIIIPSESIRIRIIANSNNINDLYQKKQLKEEIKKEIYNITKKSDEINMVRKNIINNIPSIKKMISSKIDNYRVDYGLNYFPKKVYKKVIYPAGDYESLVITLGSGQGDNWWCVLYPPLCLIEDNPNTSDIEYQLLIKEILKIDKS